MFEILEECCTPKRGTKYSAYVDLFAREDVIIGAGETKVIKLGVKLDMDSFIKDMYKKKCCYGNFEEFRNAYEDDFLKSHYLEVVLRSSLGVKGLIIVNGIGIIDLDYLGEIGLIVHNPTKIAYERAEDTGGYVECDDNFTINKGDKVAQCTLKEHKGDLMGYETETLRTGGFGSTGIWN